MGFTRKLFDRINKKELYTWGGILLSVIVLETVCTVLIPQVRKYLYDALENRHVDLLYMSFIYLSVTAAGLALAQGVKQYLSRRVGLIIREGLVKHLYLLYSKVDDKDCISNPCGRISEDSRIVTEKLLSVLTELVISLLISVCLIISMYNHPLLLSIAIVYASATLVASLLFRKPLIHRKINLQESEGLYRRSVTAVSKGTMDGDPKSLFRVLKTRYLRYANSLAQFTLYSTVQNQVAAILPLILLAPAYLSNQISLGDLMQSIVTFDLLVINLSVPVILYTQITEAQASFYRLLGFKEKLDERI